MGVLNALSVLLDLLGDDEISAGWPSRAYSQENPPSPLTLNYLSILVFSALFIDGVSRVTVQASMSDAGGAGCFLCDQLVHLCSCR